MKKSSISNLLLVLIVTVSLASFEISAGSVDPIPVVVNSSKELQEALSKAQPGAVIILNDGTYESSEFLIRKNGTHEQPIIIKGNNGGEVFIVSAFKIIGNYISLQGVTFIENGKLEVTGKGCRISYCTWDDAKPGFWLKVLPGSSEIEIDHNVFKNKIFSNQNLERNCQLIQAFVRNENERLHIHHNVFKDVANGKTRNGFETIQLITEGNPFNPAPGHSNSIIEDNLFIRCNGEAEIISVKSNGNILRRNTFIACLGGLVLRHGHDNVVTQNYFFGAGEPGSCGVRIQGSGQVIANNYFQDLGSYGLAMMDGTPTDSYVRVEKALVLFNTFVNCNSTFKIGLNNPTFPTGAVPKDCKIIGNIFFSDTGDKSEDFLEFVQNDEPENWVWRDNIGFGKKVPSISGIQTVNPELERNDMGLMVPTVNTKSAKISGKYNEVIKNDLFGNKWKKKRTLGAVQFPFETVKHPPKIEGIGED